MSIARKREECRIMVGDEKLEQVDTMKYLGVMISSDSNVSHGVLFSNSVLLIVSPLIFLMNEQVKNFRKLT